VQPPHVQHDAQLNELRHLLAASAAFAPLPFNRSTVVVVSRNGLVPSGRCKRCVPGLPRLLATLAPWLAAKGYAVVEVVVVGVVGVVVVGVVVVGHSGFVMLPMNLRVEGRGRWH
jgi:hypothetical protein